MKSFFGTLKTELINLREYPIGMPRDATCSLISMPNMLGSESTPQSAASSKGSPMRL